MSLLIQPECYANHRSQCPSLLLLHASLVSIFPMLTVIRVCKFLLQSRSQDCVFQRSLLQNPELHFFQWAGMILKQEPLSGMTSECPDTRLTPSLQVEGIRRLACRWSCPMHWSHVVSSPAYVFPIGPNPGASCAVMKLGGWIRREWEICCVSMFGNLTLHNSDVFQSECELNNQILVRNSRSDNCQINSNWVSKRRRNKLGLPHETCYRNSPRLAAIGTNLFRSFEATESEGFWPPVEL